MTADEEQLGDMLVSAGLVTTDQLAQAQALKESSGRRLGEELTGLGLLSEAQLAQVRSNQLSIPWVSLGHVEFTDELLELVPVSLAEQHCVLPVYRRSLPRTGDTLYIAMDDPTDGATLEQVRQITGLSVKPMVAPPAEIRAAIREHYRGEAPPPPAPPKPPPPPVNKGVAAGAESERAKDTEPPKNGKSSPPGGPASVEANGADGAAQAAPEDTRSKRMRALTLTFLDGTTVGVPTPSKPEPAAATSGTSKLDALLTSGRLSDKNARKVVVALARALLQKGLLTEAELVRALKQR